MTWTECPECHKATYAYGDTCDHCGAAFDGGVLPLFGVDGGPLEHFICRNCRYVNVFGARVCKNCGGTIAKSFEARVKELMQAVRENPKDSEVYREMGELYQTHNHIDEATEAFEQAVKLNPDDGVSHLRLGGIYNNLGRCDAAIDAFEKAHRLGQRDSRSHYLLGFNYEEMGLYQKAIGAYTRATELNSDLAEARYRLGLLLIQVGDREGALEQSRHLGEFDRRLGQKLFNDMKR